MTFEAWRGTGFQLLLLSISSLAPTAYATYCVFVHKVDLRGMQEPGCGARQDEHPVRCPVPRYVMAAIIITMLITLFESFVLGFAISAVPGAVFMETIRRTLQDTSSVIRFLTGNFAGIGVVISLVMSGLGMAVLNSTSANVLYAVSGGLLLYLGIHAIIAKVPNHPASHTSHKSDTAYRPFLTGLILAVANPLSILFWLSLIGRFSSEQTSSLLVITQALFVVLGALTLFIALVALIKQLGASISTTRLLLLSRVCGCVITIFGIMTIARIF